MDQSQPMGVQLLRPFEIFVQYLVKANYMLMITVVFRRRYQEDLFFNILLSLITFEMF